MRGRTNTCSVQVEIEGQICNVFVLVRPGAVDFLKKLAPFYELVIYTASLSKYADPLMDIMDKERVVSYRLFREHCTFFNGVFVKDLSLMGRDLKEVIIIDNSPNSYALQPENAFPILSWYDDPADRRLDQMIPLLENISTVDDVRKYIPLFVKNNEIDYVAAHRVLAHGTHTVPPSPHHLAESADEAEKENPAAYSQLKLGNKRAAFAGHDSQNIPDEAGSAKMVHSLELRKPLITSWTAAGDKPPPSRDSSTNSRRPASVKGGRSKFDESAVSVANSQHFPPNYLHQFSGKDRLNMSGPVSHNDLAPDKVAKTAKGHAKSASNKHLLMNTSQSRKGEKPASYSRLAFSSLKKYAKDRFGSTEVAVFSQKLGPKSPANKKLVKSIDGPVVKGRNDSREKSATLANSSFGSVKKGTTSSFKPGSLTAHFAPHSAHDVRLSLDNSISYQNKALVGFVPPSIKPAAPSNAPATTTNAAAAALLKNQYMNYSATSTPHGGVFKAFDFSGFNKELEPEVPGARFARSSKRDNAANGRKGPTVTGKAAKLNKSPTDDGKKIPGRVTSKSGASPKHQFKPDFNSSAGAGAISLVAAQNFNLTSCKPRDSSK